MYNQFNRGKFNTSSASLAVTGAARLTLTADADGSLGLNAQQSGVMIALGVTGSATRRFRTAPSSVKIVQDTAATVTKRLFASRFVASVTLELAGTSRRSVFAVRSAANLQLYSSGSGKRRFFAADTAALLSLSTIPKSKRHLFAAGSEALLMLNANSSGTRLFSAKADPVSLGLTVKGAVTMLGYATIALPGLILPPGDDLVIDTEQMTVTRFGVPAGPDRRGESGDDVTRFFDAESEFFKLKPGDNIIVFEDGALDRNTSIKILWKDLWI